MGVSVTELIGRSELQAKGMKMIADRLDTSASVSMMDLSVEAEAFGSTVRFFDDEVPTVIGALVKSQEDADALKVPEVGAFRTGCYIDGISKACGLITDRPVFAGIIGPFSLAGRLVDVTTAMMMCIENPEIMHTVLKKTVQFLIKYSQAYKDAAANGIVMAEPLTGLLSPGLAKKFSEPLPRSLDDAQIALAVINTTYASQIGLAADLFLPIVLRIFSPTIMINLFLRSARFYLSRIDLHIQSKVLSV